MTGPCRLCGQARPLPLCHRKGCVRRTTHSPLLLSPTRPVVSFTEEQGALATVRHMQYLDEAQGVYPFLAGNSPIAGCAEQHFPAAARKQLAE